MKYRSTRDTNEVPTLLSFEEAVFMGLAPDGGLYVPTHIPQIPTIKSWSTLSFQELCVCIFSLYISDEEVPLVDLKRLVDTSFSTFRHDLVTPIVPLHQPAAPTTTREHPAPIAHHASRTFILELFHGPTFAFKDVALQFLGNLFEYFLQRQSNMRDSTATEASAIVQTPPGITVLGATSGDTGGAAIYGLRNKPSVQLFILHPKNRISNIQRLQMTTVLDPNVHNISVNGTFDDCQDIVKELFCDSEFKAKYRLAAVNSINWARILAQMVYYFHGYFQVMKTLNADDFSIRYSVPTGNFGDVLAGFYAQQMGLPIAELLIATNANDILTRLGHFRLLSLNS